MTGLQVRGLVKRLGDHLAVDDLAFDVDEGQFLVLLGPSGCGKTTTLRMICGLEEPDAGEIVVGDRVITDLPPRERNLGMVFQEYGLYPSMDVFGNLAYGLQARGGLSKQEIERRVDEAAEKLGLTPHLRSPIADLSGGEQQRVALGRAMVKDADAYLFDEPLSNLDPKLRHRVRRDIVKLHREKGRPSVYVTHDQTEAFAMGDVVAIMAKGKLQQVGPPTELVENPANVFVAGFFGAPPMNLLPARLSDLDGSLVAYVRETVLPLPNEWKESVAAYGKSEVTVGVQPDAFVLNPPDSTAVLTGEVTDVEPLIGETIVRARTAEDDQLAVIVHDGAADTLGSGDFLRVGVDAERIRLFDPETEQALAR